MTITLPTWKIVLLAIVLAMVGALTAYIPTLVLDLRFLHQARMYAEFAAIQQQQSTNGTVQRTSPGTVVPGKPTPIDPPPK